MEYQKIRNLLGNIPYKVSRFIIKKLVDLMNSLEKHAILTSR